RTGPGVPVLRTGAFALPAADPGRASLRPHDETTPGGSRDRRGQGRDDVVAPPRSQPDPPPDRVPAGSAGDRAAALVRGRHVHPPGAGPSPTPPRAAGRPSQRRCLTAGAAPLPDPAGR